VDGPILVLRGASGGGDQAGDGDQATEKGQTLCLRSRKARRRWSASGARPSFLKISSPCASSSGRASVSINTRLHTWFEYQLLARISADSRASSASSSASAKQ